MTPSAPDLRRWLLDWYDGSRRDLPWRAKPGGISDPYGVWLSEIMLQQTTVAAVDGYWRAFRARWPNVDTLARADLDDIMHAWQGLGYYARARNLHACARHIVAACGGRFPGDVPALRALPGIGDYTAAAIAAIAFNKPAIPVDGNVVRVLSRLHALETPLPAARRHVARLAAPLAAAERAGDFAQALMDLGAVICTPRRPNCPVCPWRSACVARAGGSVESYPRTAGRREKRVRWGVVFWIRRGDGAVLVRKRPPRGLLGGMVEFPSTPWRDVGWAIDEAADYAPLAAKWTALPGEIRHTFTHFHLRLTVLYGISVGEGEGPEAGEAPWWCAQESLSQLPLPTLMKKVARLVAAADVSPALPLATAGAPRFQES